MNYVDKDGNVLPQHVTILYEIVCHATKFLLICKTSEII